MRSPSPFSIQKSSPIANSFSRMRYCVPPGPRSRRSNGIGSVSHDRPSHVRPAGAYAQRLARGEVADVHAAAVHVGAGRGAPIAEDPDRALRGGRSRGESPPRLEVRPAAAVRRRGAFAHESLSVKTATA